MFNKSFYPTPIHLVQKMIDKVKDKIVPGVSILEPSAGKGDIAKAIGYINNRVKPHLIEIEPELREISKQYGRMVAYDFLTFEPDTNYDIILMNPPFENGDEHLLKAWEISKNTTIVCLLNAETYLNPYSEKRKALKNIIDE
jgi:tRNA1(Val) A37 N6-methylase TrmN6